MSLGLLRGTVQALSLDRRAFVEPALAMVGLLWSMRYWPRLAVAGSSCSSSIWANGAVVMVIGFDLATVQIR